MSGPRDTRSAGGQASQSWFAPGQRLVVVCISSWLLTSGLVLLLWALFSFGQTARAADSGTSVTQTTYGAPTAHGQPPEPSGRASTGSAVATPAAAPTMGGSPSAADSSLSKAVDHSLPPAPEPPGGAGIPAPTPPPAAHPGPAGPSDTVRPPEFSVTPAERAAGVSEVDTPSAAERTPVPDATPARLASPGARSSAEPPAATPTALAGAPNRPASPSNVTAPRPPAVAAAGLPSAQNMAAGPPTPPATTTVPEPPEPALPPAAAPPSTATTPSPVTTPAAAPDQGASSQHAAVPHPTPVPPAPSPEADLPTPPPVPVPAAGLPSAQNMASGPPTPPATTTVPEPPEPALPPAAAPPSTATTPSPVTTPAAAPDQGASSQHAAVPHPTPVPPAPSPEADLPTPPPVLPQAAVSAERPPAGAAPSGSPRTAGEASGTVIDATQDPTGGTQQSGGTPTRDSFPSIAQSDRGLSAESTTQGPGNGSAVAVPEQVPPPLARPVTTQAGRVSSRGAPAGETSSSSLEQALIRPLPATAYPRSSCPGSPPVTLPGGRSQWSSARHPAMSRLPTTTIGLSDVAPRTDSSVRTPGTGQPSSPRPLPPPVPVSTPVAQPCGSTGHDGSHQASASGASGVLCVQATLGALHCRPAMRAEAAPRVLGRGLPPGSRPD